MTEWFGGPVPAGDATRALRRATFAPFLQAKLLYTVLEGSQGNAENLSGPFPVPPHLGKDLPDGLPFVHLQDASVGNDRRTPFLQIQMPHVDLPLGEDHGALDHVLQLPHISRPMVIFHRRPRFRGKPIDRLAGGDHELLQEIFRQRQNGIPTIPKR